MGWAGLSSLHIRNFFLSRYCSRVLAGMNLARWNKWLRDLAWPLPRSSPKGTRGLASVFACIFTYSLGLRSPFCVPGAPSKCSLWSLSFGTHLSWPSRTPECSGIRGPPPHPQLVKPSSSAGRMPWFSQGSLTSQAFARIHTAVCREILNWGTKPFLSLAFHSAQSMKTSFT